MCQGDRAVAQRVGSTPTFGAPQVAAGAQGPHPPPEEGVVSAVAAAIRRARTAAGLSMRAAARAAEVSQPFWSQVESGAASPSLLTLYRMASALGVPPSELLPSAGASEEIVVVRAGEGRRVRVSDEPNAAVGRLISAGAGRRLVVSEYVVDPGQDLGDRFVSAGDMTVLLLAGRIDVTLQGRGVWRLDAGDAISHPGSIENRWVVVGDETARILLAYAADPRPTD
jgi:transcriptional regulator with XRE-family HTH domain